jgi:hypothetical protein
MLGMGLGLGISLGRGAKAGAGVVAPVPVPASSGLRPADRAVAHSSSHLTSLQVIPGKSPNRALKNPRVWLPGFYCNNLGNNPTEMQLANQFQAEYALGIGTGAANRRRKASFGGQPSTTRGGAGSLYGYSTANDWGIWSDPIKEADGSDLLIPPNSDLLHCSIVLVANTAHVFPSQVASAANAAGNVSRGSTTGDFAVFESFLTSTGTITQLSNSPAGYGPVMMVAEDAGTGELVSFLLTGDSRFYGVGDFGSGLPASQSSGARQAGARAMVSLGFPHANISIPGSKPDSDTECRYEGIRQCMALYGGKSPFTHTLSNHGNNGDLTANITNIQTERAGLASLLGAAAKHGKTTLPPRIGTGGDYRTTAGQTPAADDTYPNGKRAILNNFILANTSGGAPIWDFVIDMGKYGSAAKDMAYGAGGFDQARSAFPSGPSSTVAVAWSTGTSITLNGNAFQPGDMLSLGATFDRTKLMGPVTAAVDNGNGTQTLTIETGGTPSSVSYAVGDPVTRISTKDGTHEATWVSVLEAAAITEWSNAGRPARYPAA